MGKRLTIALAIFGLLAVPLGTYTAGYFCLGDGPIYWPPLGTKCVGSTSPTPEFATIQREFPQRWLTTIYRPAGNVEAWLRGVEVHVTWSASQEELRSYLDRQASHP